MKLGYADEYGAGDKRELHWRLKQETTALRCVMFSGVSKESSVVILHRSPVRWVVTCLEGGDRKDLRNVNNIEYRHIYTRTTIFTSMVIWILNEALCCWMNRVWGSSTMMIQI
jgi:hypothetical protein